LIERQQSRFAEYCLWGYASLLGSLTVLAWVLYLIEGRPGLRKPLFDRGDRFMDLMNYMGKISHLGDGAAALARGLPVYNYPAPAAYVYAFFLRGFPHHAVRAYLCILLAGALGGAVLLYRSARSGRRIDLGLIAAIAATEVLGSPLVFTADRANLEGITALVLGTGLVLYVMKRYYGSAVFIGLAAAIKPFPGIFFLLLVRKKLYRETVAGIAVAVGTVLVALTALGPTPLAAFRGLQPGVNLYVNDYIMAFPTPGTGRFEHSIMDSMKSAAMEWKHIGEDDGRANPAQVQTAAPGLVDGPVRSSHYIQIHRIFLLSMAVCGVVFLFVLLRIFKLPSVNQMILLSVALTLLPPVSAEYTLLEMFVPFGVFLIFLTRDVATGVVDIKRRNVAALLCLFAFLFAPLTFFGRFAGDLQMLLLAALLLMVANCPMPSSIFGEVPAAEGRDSIIAEPMA
jgi:hypothetical protein